MKRESLFTLRYLDTGVYMMVLHTQGMLLYNKMLNLLEIKKVQGVDINAVQWLATNPNQEGKIAEPQQEVLINETCQVTASRDKMKAFISFLEPDGGKLMNIKDIIDAVQGAKIAFGIDTNLIRSLGNNAEKTYDEDVLVATGKPPVNGVDAAIDLKFKVARDKTPKMLENGQVDFKSKDTSNYVQKGDLLAVLTPHTIGDKGMNVIGMEILPKPGKAKTLPAGKYTIMSDDKLQLFANSEGSAEVQDGRIVVIREMKIEGDVGVPTGHINFPGDVFIGGNVLSTYNVTAGGSIEVGGCIEASVIEAAGDVVIRQGVKGMSAKGSDESCIITARGNVTCKFIENATVNAIGVVRSDSLVNSRVASNSEVIIEGKIGNIIGGRTSALKSISCYEVGSDASFTTAKLEVGATAEIRSNYEAIKAKIDGIIKRITEIDSILAEFENMTSLSTSQDNRRCSLNEEKEKISESLMTLTRDLKTIGQTVQDGNSGQIKVRDNVNPSVDVNVGMFNKTIDEKVSHVTFRVREDEVVSDTY